jgi:hypothetical protein
MRHASRRLWDQPLDSQVVALDVTGILDYKPEPVSTGCEVGAAYKNCAIVVNSSN